MTGNDQEPEVCNTATNNKPPFHLVSNRIPEQKNLCDVNAVLSINRLPQIGDAMRILFISIYFRLS